jgi:hypothetical protein
VEADIAKDLMDFGVVWKFFNDVQNVELGGWWCEEGGERFDVGFGEGHLCLGNKIICIITINEY